MREFYERFKETLSYNVVIVNVVGIMGTGKTNWCHFLGNTVENIFPMKFFKFYIRYTNIVQLKKKLSFLARNLRKINKKLRKHFGLMLVFDDISFIQRDIEFLQKIANIRHYKGFSHFYKYIIIFAYHYSKGALPFLRQSHVRVLTSLNSRYEIEQLKEYFDLNDLWNFYEIKNESIKRYRFHSLVNIMSKHYIVKPPLSYDNDLIPIYLPKEKKANLEKWIIYQKPDFQTLTCERVQIVQHYRSFYVYAKVNGTNKPILVLKRVQ